MPLGHGDLRWTFYGIFYSGVLFALGWRVQQRKGPSGSATGLQAIAIFAICLDSVRAVYYLQWIAIPLVIGTLGVEIAIMRRENRTSQQRN